MGERATVGYPGFVVMRPARLLPNVGTLKRIAVAKLAGIRMVSASFSGDRLLFQPWLTVMVDEGPRLRPVDRADAGWEFVSVKVAGEVRAFGVEYSPLTASIDLIESALPGWLASVDRAVGVPGSEPDGPLTISIDRSVPELVGQTG
ncbi:hypothetical protein AB0J51_20020 [Micromonospora echinofusca]|uniref:hypothetical protein n=1 Tax=Micromonospora echinofusca TaxID=47858 RepID=UPI003420E486